jgi:dihydrofolate reductase
MGGRVHGPTHHAVRTGSLAAVGTLTYTAIASLDGYVADAEGRWDWSFPSEEVHAAVNAIERRHGTLLLGRRMYEVLVAWETMETEGEPPEIAEYAEIWRGADKVVVSTTLDAPRSARTTIERSFEPERVRALKADGDLGIGGPALAAQALLAGLVDEIHLFLSPAIVGGGTQALPDGLRLDLELLDERRFANGVVAVHYRVR